MTRYLYDMYSSKWFVSGVLIIAVSGKLFIYKEEGRGKNNEPSLLSRCTRATIQELKGLLLNTEK